MSGRLHAKSQPQQQNMLKLTLIMILMIAVQQRRFLHPHRYIKQYIVWEEHQSVILFEAHLLGGVHCNCIGRVCVLWLWSTLENHSCANAIDLCPLNDLTVCDVFNPLMHVHVITHAGVVSRALSPTTLSFTFITIVESVSATQNTSSIWSSQHRYQRYCAVCTANGNYLWVRIQHL